ncbi:CRISPR locus-related DNA-binding protein [Desulfurococcaceae archaeon AG1]|nr:CRISPR locus-related DNA-binding protein [Desulfurococcaceae archaeon AG1]
MGLSPPELVELSIEDPEDIISSALDTIQTLEELTEEKRRILETIVRNPGITPPQLARIMRKSEKTIANHITELKKQNLVITRGKTNNIHPTKLGTIIAKIIKQKTKIIPGSTGKE